MSSGYITADVSTETYTILDTTSDDMCEEVWTYTIGSTVGKACVKITTKVSRPFMADDPATEMSINHDPDASSGLATTYTFRARFGSTSETEATKYQCADQTIDFSQFYGDIPNCSASQFIAAASLAALLIVF